MKQLYSAGVIVFRVRADGQREYLILHYPHGHWDLAKGKMEAGETKHQAAERELFEETGLHAHIISGFEEQLSYIFRHEKMLTRKTVYFYVGQAKTEDVRLSIEHIGYEWLPFSDAIQQLTFANAKQVLHAADKFLNK
jgi:8-oxo-dGTP pyrophosphatase MutT (NUDIX family)